ncbi:MAG TPA: protein kinase [Nocardioidaceae bacterium]|nr:protein kinase [Nocardioidaceae bacterium]
MADNPIGRGTVLAGRFRLEDLLQETAGAKFWRATDQILARSVAVHVIDASDSRAEALLVAARASAAVTDGRLLRVLDAAEEDEVAYVVNEWSAGSSLDLMLSEGPLPPRRAAWLVKEVAETITTAHRHGVAHGRLIPENVMVTESGSVKLIGFAIDAVLNGASGPPAGSDQPNDRPNDRPSDQDVDVMNLASLLYAALVGRWPGSGGSTLPEAPREHGRALRPRKVRAGVPRPLDAICDRFLHIDTQQPEIPIGRAQDLSVALSDFIADPASVTSPGHEPTTVIRDLPVSGAAPVSAPGPGAEPGGDDLDPTEVAVARSTPPEARPPTSHEGPPWSAAEPESEPAHARDPEATQVAAPPFYDADSGVSRVADSGVGSPEGASRRPLPPPVVPEVDPRPLFAPDPPGGRSPSPQPERTDRADHRTGHGTGSLPAVWGPDAADPDAADASAQWQPEDAGKSWLRLAAMIAAILLLVLVIILAFNLGRGGEEPPPSPQGDGSAEPSETGATAGPLTIAGVSDFDPEGDPPEENAELAELAVDGDPATAWRTMTYFNNPQLGLLKDGVGLVVDLGETADVSQVQLTLIGRPNNVELLAAEEGAALPTSTDGLQQVAAAEDTGPRVDLNLEEPVSTQYVVVWLTSLPPAEGGYQGQIAEIVVRP